MKIDLSKPENAIDVAEFDLGFLAKNKLCRSKKLSQLAMLNSKNEKIAAEIQIGCGCRLFGPCLCIVFRCWPPGGLLCHWVTTSLQAERAHHPYVEVCSESRF